MLDEALCALVAGAVAEAMAPLERELRALRAAVSATSGRWCNRREAAETLRVSLDTVDRMLARGVLRSRRLGRRVAVYVESPVAEDEIARLAASAREARS